MAQYKGGEERRQFEQLIEQERLSDSDYDRESHQKPQGDGHISGEAEPENVTYTIKEGFMSGANAGTPVEERRDYGTVDTNARPPQSVFGSLTPGGYGTDAAYSGEKKFSSDTGSNVSGGASRESGENAHRKHSGYANFSGGESDHHQASDEESPFAKQESGRKHEVGIEGLNETSQHDSKEDYNKRGLYGGKGYATNMDYDNVSGSFGVTATEKPTIIAAAVGQAQKYDDMGTPVELISQYGSEERPKKEDVKEKLVPGHKTEVDRKEERVDSPKQEEGFLGKIKEKLTAGRPRDTDSTNYDRDMQVDQGDESEAAHKKKGVIEKIKEKLSPST